MARAKSGDVVRVHYTGRLEDGAIFDTSANRGPLQFTIGEDQVITGFEQAVVGMNPGESKTVEVSADEAYGPHREEMIVAVSREQLPAELEPRVGQRLHIQQEGGRTIPVIVSEVSETSVTLDANHPLAGRDLTFDIQLLEVV